MDNQGNQGSASNDAGAGVFQSAFQTPSSGAAGASGPSIQQNQIGSDPMQTTAAPVSQPAQPVEQSANVSISGSEDISVRLTKIEERLATIETKLGV